MRLVFRLESASADRSAAQIPREDFSEQKSVHAAEKTTKNVPKQLQLQRNVRCKFFRVLGDPQFRRKL